MGIRFDASGDSLSRARLAGAKTIMAWVYIATDRNDYSAFFGVAGNELVETNNDGVTLIHYDGSVDRTGSTLVVGTWYHLAYVSLGDAIGNGFTVYLNGVSNITASGRAAASSGTTMYLGNDEYSEWLNGRMAHVKIWNAAAAADEVAAEMYSFAPQRVADLWGWLPAISTGADRSSEWAGSGNAWTANGTQADEDGPAVVANNLPFWSVPWVVAAAAASIMPAAFGRELHARSHANLRR